jgi:hypothetical protein
MSGGKLNLILGFHAHVPSGSADGEFEDAYEKKLRPFVSTLCKFPAIQAALHCSGVLLHWVERNRPELFMLIEDMVSRRQLELLGGGFYEPMLPLISPQDRIGQIELLTTYLRRQFGKRPLGCWIPALAWEQHLVGSLAASGMNYTFLSEEQFARAGLSGGDLRYPSVSEDQGKLVTVFPVSAAAVLLAANGVSDFFEFARKEQAQGGRILAVFPDAVFAGTGESPDFAWARFFGELVHSADVVEAVMPSKLFKGLKGLKKAAFPDSAGFETGGEAPVSPRRFIIEHTGAGGVYTKMIFVNMLINQLKGDKSRKLNAREELWKAQDSGLFSGGEDLRNSSLRKAAYRSLLSAERITREKGKFVSSLAQYDFDLDGADEYLFQDSKINCYIQLTGAGIFELDYLPKNWNYLDAGPSWQTGGAAQKRGAFTDWLLPAGTKPAELLSALTGGARPEQTARLCFTEKYETTAHDRSKGRVCLNLPPVDSALPFGNIDIEKCFSLKKDILTVNYALKNRGKESETFCFVPELNLSFAGSGEDSARFFLNGADGLKIQDIKNEVQINFNSAKPFECAFGPVYLAAGENSVGCYQADCVMPLFTVSLMGGETWLNEFTLKFAH